MFLLLSLDCQSISERMHKSEIVSEAYVNNPNGLVLYKTKGDLKSKEVVLKPEEKFYFLEKSNKAEKESWRKVLYDGKELFTTYGYYYSHFDIWEYQPLDNGRSRFAVTEQSTDLMESPNTYTTIKSIQEFSVIEVLSFGSSSGSHYKNNHEVLKVKTQDNKIGFIDSPISMYKTELIAQKNAKAEVVQSEGYFMVTAIEPIFLDIESMSPIDKTKYKEILSKDNLVYVNYSKKIDGVRYYSFRSGHPLEYLLGDSSILIPESNGKFLNEKDFTEYTIQNKNFKGDKSIIEQVKKLQGYFLNFSDFKLTKLSDDFKGGKYYLVTVRKGMSDIYSSYLLKEYKDAYSQIEVKGSLGIVEVKTFDLDGDGVLEILSLVQERGSAYYELFGMRNGKYQIIASLSTDTEFIKNVIYVKNGFSEYLPSKDENAYSNSRAHSSRMKLKYQKGKLIKIK